MIMTSEEIVRHYRQAANPAEDIVILADLNCTNKRAICNILISAGESVPTRRAVNVVQAAKLYRLGFNDQKIGRELGCSKSAIQKWRKKEGLPPNWNYSKKECAG